MGDEWMGGDWVTIFLADILDQFKVQDLIILTLLVKFHQ